MTYNSFIPHGHCYLWKPGQVWLHVVSDSLIALAYYGISITLIYLVQKRKDLPFDWIFLLFSIFIIACGTTHLMEVWTLWHPIYWVWGTLKALTAGVSLCGAVMLIALVPQILALPSPAELEAANQQLRREIAEREQVEAALHASQSRLAGILDIADDAIISVDETQSITLFNQGAEKIFGYSAEEILGQSLDLLLPSRFGEMHRQHIGEFANSPNVVARGMGQRREIIGRRQDGSEFPAEASISKLELEGETIFTVILRDISDRIAAQRDRIQAQKALQYSEERLRLTLEATCIGIWDWNLLNNRITWNDNHARLFGLVPGTFLVNYQAFRSRVHPEDIERVETPLSIALETKTDYAAEYRVIWPDGSIHWIEAKGRGFYDPAGRAIRMMGTVMDISDRQAQEAALRRANDELEHRVIQRTQELFEANITLRTEIAEREWAERGVTVQYATTRVLAEAATLTEMYSRILPAICNSLGWVAGEFWSATRGNGSLVMGNGQSHQLPITNSQFPIPNSQFPITPSLQCVKIWQAPEINYPEFKAISQTITFAPGIGLPGGVWATNEPIWIADVVEDDLFLRSEIAAEIGLHAAFGFPIRIGSEILGVITCFSRQIQPPDVDLLDLMTSIGNQIGQFIQRKQAEETLQEIATLQNAILNSANYTVISTKVDGTIRTFNAAAERMLGYTAAEVIGKTTPAIIHDWDEVVQRAQELSQELGITIAPGFEAFVAKARRGEIDEREWTYIRKDGSRFPVLLSVTALYDGDNNITGFLGIGSDITERKQAQEALQRYAAEIEDLYNYAPCGYHSLDADGNVIRINDTELNMLGYAREEIIGKHVTDFLAPDSWATFQENFALFKQNGSVHNLELNFMRKDGTILPVSLNATALKDEAGNYLMSRSTIFDISARKQAEAALRQSEADYRAVVEDQTELICRFLPNGVLTFVNQAYCRYFDRQLEEILHNGFMSLIPEEERALVAQNIASLSADKPYISHEHRVILPTGEIRWHQWMNRAIFNDQGQIVEYQAVGQDITDRKQAEAALRQSEERLQLALEASGDGLWDWKIPTGEVYLSPRWLLMLGYDIDEYVANLNTWESMIHPEDRPWVMEVLNNHLQDSSVPYAFDYRVRTKSGEWKWIGNYGKVVARDEQGNPLRMAGTHKDISDRKAREAEIRNLNRALEIAVVGISQIDLPGSFIQVNPAYTSMLGYQREEIIGMDWQQTVHPDDREKTLAAYQQMLANDKAEVEVRAVGKDGSVFDQKIVMVKAYDQEQFIGHYGFMKDISDRREIERLKDEFVSIVSHELRTPLTSISGALDLLASGLLQAQPEEAQRMLNIAANNTERLVRLINDILDIERIESGKVSMTKQICQAENLMLQSVEVVQEMARNAGVTISVSPLKTSLWANPDRIIQVFTNLLSNAIKFSPSGSTVWLSGEDDRGTRERGDAGMEEDGGTRERGDGENVSRQLDPSPRLPFPASSSPSPYVLFKVTDTGRGIPADKLESIFAPFQQVDASDSRAKGGTGLGLAICRSILQLHGGQIWAESNLGQGSTFYFTLPVFYQPETDSPAFADSQIPLVLICDDDADIRFVVKTTLEQQGYRVIAVGSGQEAIGQAIANHPDAIILNLMMPGMDGWETLAQLKQHEETQNIPAIVLSGLLPDNREVPHPGVNDWIVKPPDRQTLCQALEKALAKQNQTMKVLVVEDDLDLAQVLIAMFERYGIETFYARTGREAIQLSQRLLPDLLILDLGLPEGDGFAVVDWLRHHNRLCHVPLVVYTSRDLSQSDRDRLKLGQTLFLTKARITPQEFERRVINLLNRIVRVQEGPSKL
jgi:PAS domain S-box-containing protein